MPPPETAPKKKKKPTVRISSSGLKRVGGRVYEEFLPELRFPQGLRVYDEMRKNSGVVGGFLRAVGSSFRSVKWVTAPADDSPDAAMRAAFHESCRDDMELSWNDFVSNAVTCLPFGFAAHEMWFKLRQGRKADPSSKYTDGRVGIAGLPLVGHDSIQEWAWDLDDPNKLTGLWQIAPPKHERVMLPRAKMLLFRTCPEKDNPEGESLLRQAYYDYYSMMRLENIESISLERTGMGIPAVILPKDATSEVDAPGASDEAAAQALVSKVRVDEQGGIVVPHGWEFQLIRPTGRVDPQLFDLAIRRHRTGMLISVLAVFLELGSARVGSFALAKQGQGFFEIAFEGYVQAFEETYNEEVIPLLFELNGVDDKLPKLTHTTAAGVNVQAIVEAVTSLVDTGLVDGTDPTLQSYMRDLLRLPRGDTVEELEKPAVSRNGDRPDDEDVIRDRVRREDDEEEEDDELEEVLED